MERIQSIIKHPIFIQELQSITHLEQTRIYCGHNLEHLLSVARIGWIYILENKLPIPKELWYSCALLHDIGRGLQYTHNIPHHEGGIQLARQILLDCHYTQEEINWICQAIAGHRKTMPSNPTNMEELLIWADKKSRNCFLCAVSNQCNWPNEKKTNCIFY